MKTNAAKSEFGGIFAWHGKTTYLKQFRHTRAFSEFWRFGNMKPEAFAKIL